MKNTMSFTINTLAGAHTPFVGTIVLVIAPSETHLQIVLQITIQIRPWRNPRPSNQPRFRLMTAFMTAILRANIRLATTRPMLVRHSFEDSLAGTSY